MPTDEVIRFKDREGIDGELFVRLPRTGIVQGGYSAATPDDMARAYHAMTDEQVLEMARAHSRLPMRPGWQRSFDASFVREIERLELREKELADEGRNWAELYERVVAAAAAAVESGKLGDLAQLLRLLGDADDTAPAKEKP